MVKLISNTFYIFILILFVFLQTPLISQAKKPIVVTAENPSSVTSSTAILKGTVNPNGLPTFVWFEWGTMSNLLIKTVSPEQKVDSSAAYSNVSAEITGLVPYKSYYFRLMGRNADGTTAGSITAFRTALPPFPDSIKLTYTYNFPNYQDYSYYKGYEYKLVGLPGNFNGFLNSLIKGVKDAEWKAFTTNSKGEIFKYNGSDLFKFSTGKSFLILNKGPLKIDTNAPIIHPVDQNLLLPLSSGWNLITNPFTLPIQWSIIQKENLISEPIFALNNNNNTNYTFTTSSNFDPYNGYYFYNTDKLELKIPYYGYYVDSSFTLPKTHIKWQIGISLVAGAYEDRTTFIGIASSENTDISKNNHFKPKLFSDLPNIYISESSDKMENTGFCSIILPENKELYEWDLNLSINPAEKNILFFNGISDLPESYEIFLIDLNRIKIVNLRKDSIYTLTKIQKDPELKIIAGKKEQVQKKSSEFILPVEYSLGKNYPNPFNPETRIPVEIPIISDIKFIIFDILGNEVKKVYSGMIEPGKYIFEWSGINNSGSSVSSGIYFYSLLINSNKKLTGKMILLR